MFLCPRERVKGRKSVGVVVSACWMIGTSVKSLLMLLSPPSVMASHEGGRRYMDRRELFSVDSGIDTREM